MAERQAEPSVTLPPEINGSFRCVDAKTGGVAVLNTIAGPIPLSAVDYNSPSHLSGAEVLALAGSSKRAICPCNDIDIKSCMYSSALLFRSASTDSHVPTCFSFPRPQPLTKH